jgi:hypothetical protein
MEQSAMESRNLLMLLVFHCKTRRDVSTSLDMTKRLIGAVFVGLLLLCRASAQESLSPTPTPSLTPEQPPAATPSSTAAPSPTESPVRNVRISFVPPPMEGTISLGVFDSNRRLVRVLHRESELNEFTIGADALLTKWDGKNDDGEDLPPGKYRGRGYLVGHFKIEDLGIRAAPPPTGALDHVAVKLVTNPLVSDTRSVVDLGVGFDDNGSFLKTTDDLPLFTVSKTPNLIRAVITRNGEKSVDIWEDDGSGVRQFRVSNVDRMMAFDCGGFELK